MRKQDNMGSQQVNPAKRVGWSSNNIQGEHVDKTGDIIEARSGCGPFNIVIFCVVVATNMATVSYAIVFMSFGNYNPGWRCMDNVTSHDNSTSITDPYDVDYTTGSCDVYDQCHHVEFNPQTSTIVTEWGLLCDKSWIPSMMISIQMAGMLIFSFLAGQIADTFGRKTTLYGGVVIGGILQLVSAVSVSWGMFVVLLFFSCGVAVANMLVVYIYVAENMTIKWRVIVAIFPFWHCGATLQAVIALITKDWRQMYFVGFVLHVICFIPVIWVPESLRWLEVKSKSKQFNSVAQKIAKLNKTGDPPKLDGASLIDHVSESRAPIGTGKKYSIIDIFRHGYALISICIGTITFVFSMIFYATVFGTKALYGDFYVNLIVTNITSIPVVLICLVGIKYTSRRRITYVMLGVAASCIFLATGLLFSSSEEAKSIGCTILITVARSTVDTTWACMFSRAAEIYPTVVRGIGVGYSSMTARAGGILAPFIIPDDKDHLYIFTIISGALILLCCLLNIALPETKGKPLKENFDSCVHEIKLVQSPECEDKQPDQHAEPLKTGGPNNTVCYSA